jgi:hypothetical protein
VSEILSTLIYLKRYFMKAIITAVAVAGLFTFSACNNSTIRQQEAALKEQQQKLDAITMEMAKKRVIDSMNEVNKMQFSTMQNPYMMQPNMVMPNGVQYVNTTPQVRYVTQRSYARPRTVARRSSRSYSGYSQPVVYQQPRKRGWSAKAKGAVIGGAGGAIAGAIINKRNRPVGALIGGVLGAGAGTGIGAIIDRNNGR